MTALQKELEEIKAELVDLEARFTREKAEAEKDNYLSQEERDLLQEISDLIQEARLQRGRLEIDVAREQLAQTGEDPDTMKIVSEDGESISKEEAARILAGEPMYSGEKEETDSAEDKSEPFVPPTEANEPTLRKGDESADGWVEYLQQMLNHQLGAGTVAVNGKFDQATDKAVREFQGQAGCKVDGIVGNQTWSALREDKVLAEIGTDGRKPGEFVEIGAEARWGTESADSLSYDEASDELRLVVVSVGNEPIDDFSADVFVNGARQTIKIGKPEVKSKTGSGDDHWVRVRGFSAAHGTGPFKIEAYLPQELGGDKWSGELDTLPGKELGGGELTIQVNNKATGAPIEGATVIFEDPAGSFDTVTEKTDSGGQTIVYLDEGMQVTITAKTGNDSQSRKVTMGDKNDTLVFEMDASGGELGGGELTIQVNDKATGDPIEGATVIFGASKDFDTVEEATDAKGQTVAYFEEGWIFTVTVKTGDDEQSQKVTMGDKNDTLVFKMGDAAKTKNEAEVSITVVDIIDNNLPIEGAEVFIDAGSLGKARDWTDSKGVVTYFVQDVETIFVKASLPGDSQSKTLKLNKPLVEHTFRLEQHADGGDTYKLFVDVHGEDSKEGLAADVEISGGPPGFKPITEKNTSRVVAFVTDGEYVVSAKTDFDDQARMLTVKGEDLRHVFEMNEPGGGELTIQVNNKETGDPIEGATVVFGDSKDFDTFEQATDEKGQTLAYFDEKNTFTVTVKTDDDEQSRKVTMGDKNDTLVFKMEESGGGGAEDLYTLTIVVNNIETLAPIEGADVVVVGPSSIGTVTAKTDRQGKVEIKKAPSGGYVAKVSKGEDSKQGEITIVDADEALTFELTEPTNKDEPFADSVLNVFVHEAGIIEPIEGATVAITGGPTGFGTKEAATDKMGEAKFDGCLEGDYTIMVSTDHDSEKRDVHFDGIYQTYKFGLDPAPDPDGARILVNVQGDRSGDSIMGASVEISGGPKGFKSLTTKTGGSGGVEIGALKDGTYTLMVKSETPKDEQEKSVKVAGKNQTVLFEMRETPGLKGAKLVVEVIHMSDEG